MKAEDTTTIDLSTESTIADYMVVTSGRSNRHVGAVADQVLEDLHEAGVAGLHGQSVVAVELPDLGAVGLQVEPDGAGRVADHRAVVGRVGVLDDQDALEVLDTAT